MNWTGVGKSTWTAGVTGLVAGALTLAMVGAPANAEPEDAALRQGPGAAGIGDSYWPKDGNGGIDVRSYTINNRYQTATGKLAGKTRIQLVATGTVSSFNLDFLLPVKAVKVDGKKTGFTRPDGHELKIKKKLAKGQKYSVLVRYAGQPGDYRYAGESNWLADKHEAVAMNEPHMSPWWFPGNDHPQDKATFKINITVPKGQQAIANGNLIGKRKAGDSVTWKWVATEPMTTYLAFFGAGKFAIDTSTVDGLTMVNAVSKQLSPGQQEAGLKWLGRTDEIVADLEKDYGPYPFDSMGGLITGLPVGFALENQTRPTYPAGVSGNSLLVHELAHQWFGDSVAVHKWRDIWLNEGFATFAEARYAEKHGGDSADEWLRDEYASNGPNSQLWKLNLANPGPGNIFDGAVYYRGGMTVQALRNRIGEGDFWKLMKAWTNQHRKGNAKVAQFEKLAESISGEDLDGFFDAWLRNGTKPANTAENGLG